LPGSSGVGQQQQQPKPTRYEHDHIPENDVANPGIAAFLNGKPTPRKRHVQGKRIDKTPRSSTSSSTQSKSTTKTRSDSSSYNRTNENDAPSFVNENVRPASSRSSDTPKKQKKTSSSAEAEAGGRLDLSPTPKKTVLSPASLLRNLSARKQKQKGVAMKEASTQTDPWRRTIVFKVYLNKDVTRSLSDPTHNPERACIGKGELVVLKCDKGNDTVYFCCLIGDDGALKFQAEIPKSSEAHKHMRLKPGRENSIEWDAYDTSDATSAKLRAFTFSFDGGEEMFATLLHFFGGSNIAIVKEFLLGGRFWAEKETLPPHPVKKGEDDMDVDGEEHRQLPLREEEANERYGKVTYETQNF
jgi:hypothetical protein